MSKNCPPNKIFNEETGRYVLRTGKAGLKILGKSTKNNIKTKKANNNSKKLIKDPLESKYKGICDTGLVSAKTKPLKDMLIQQLSFQIGEFQDVYCVANSNKLLASLDYSTYGKKKLKAKNAILINNVIDYANSKGVQYLHNKKTGGMYLKSIFFLPKNYREALKLMYILWYSKFSNIDNHISIGLLLNYDIDNIIYFSKNKLGIEINKKYVESIQKKLSELNITLEMLQKDYKIVHKTSIEKLKL